MGIYSNMGGTPTKQPDLQDVAMDLRMTSRTMEKQAQKLEQSETANKKKILEALSKNQMETAKIHAETVIRNKKEAISIRRFGVKMGALSSKLESAYRTQEVSKSISQSVPLLQNAMRQMDSNG